jgi:hypothetical protein
MTAVTDEAEEETDEEEAHGPQLQEITMFLRKLYCMLPPD